VSKVKFQALRWVCSFWDIKYALYEAFHCALTAWSRVLQAVSCQLLQYSRNLPHSKQASVSLHVHKDPSLSQNNPVHILLFILKI